jgi:hypothetical protein
MKTSARIKTSQNRAAARIWCGAGKRPQLLILGKARRCCPILARACEAHKTHLIERIVAAAQLDWKVIIEID